MPALQAIRGRIVDLRHHINVEVYWRRPPGPTDRYELWIRREDGREYKVTINTRNMPARRGHAVSVIVRTDVKPVRVMGLFNASTMDAANYMRTDPPPLLRVADFVVVLPVLFVLMAAWWGDAGMALFVLLAPAYLLFAMVSRRVNRAAWAIRIDRALADEAARNGWKTVP